MQVENYSFKGKASLRFESLCWKQGARLVAGLDEAGRGAWAGPVVAAAVILRPGRLPASLTEVNDSKQVPPLVRERLFDVICAECAAWGVGEASPAEIDTLNIVQATRLAMGRALAALAARPDMLLVDALTLPAWRGSQRALVHGDARSVSIAAASILAKVSRDRTMRALDEAYPAYGFGQHKGYGTPEHQSALAEHGPLDLHRRTFAPVGLLLGCAAAENDLPWAKRIVAQGYDRSADAYARLVEDMGTEVRERYLAIFLNALPEGAQVLELGCGAGTPMTQALVGRFQVTALDLSTEQLKRAQRNAPSARLMRADMAHVPAADTSFDAVAAFYSLTHLPRAEHAQALAEMARVLRPGGLLVLTTGAQDNPEQLDLDWLGAPMFFSHFDGTTNTRLVREAGFEIVRAADEPETEYGRPVCFRWIVARKQNR